jgi:hypothetical protein
LCLILHAATAEAHHSFAAEYDGKKPASFTGTVTKVEWTNPHVHFFLDVKGPRRLASRQRPPRDARRWTQDVGRHGI